MTIHPFHWKPGQAVSCIPNKKNKWFVFSYDEKFDDFVFDHETNPLFEVGEVMEVFSSGMFLRVRIPGVSPDRWYFYKSLVTIEQSIMYWHTIKS